MPKSEADLMDDAALAGATFRMIGEKWVATVDAPCRFIAIGDTREAARANLAVLLRAARPIDTAPTPPMHANWVPVHERIEADVATPHYTDTASTAIFSLRLTCACGNSHHFNETGGSALWACYQCGRVYRAQARFSVQQHVGEEGAGQ